MGIGKYELVEHFAEDRSTFFLFAISHFLFASGASEH